MLSFSRFETSSRVSMLIGIMNAIATIKVIRV